MTRKFSRKLNELPAIAVQVTNRGSEPFAISPAKIEAFADAKPVKVYSQEDYLLLVKRAAQTEYLLTDARENGNAIASNLGTSGVAPKPMLAGKAEAANERIAIRDRQLKLIGAASEMLYPKTVAPGETFGGVIRLQASPLLSAQRLRLRVTIGDETHEVYFALSR
jgi:hypothetical protein